MLRIFTLAVTACLGSAMLAAAPVVATQAHTLEVSVGLAPVAPDGLSAGAVTDFIVAFADLDPTVDGIALQAGGSIRITLPLEFENQGTLPVAASGAIPGCGPPVVTTCSTAVILQGWPQSPVLPFPSVDWEPETNTVVLTARADWTPAEQDAPGPKTVHLQLFGFTNPDRPGNYDIDVTIQPDPDHDLVLTGSGKAHIAAGTKASVTSVSLANGAPPPPFPNTLYQSISAGDTSLTMMLYLWAADLEPLVGASFDDGSARVRLITDAAGRPIGRVAVTVPRGAGEWALVGAGPATPARAFITGYETATMRAVLETDPAATGTYAVRFHLFGGNTVTHRITAD